MSLVENSDFLESLEVKESNKKIATNKFSEIISKKVSGWMLLNIFFSSIVLDFLSLSVTVLMAMGGGFAGNLYREIYTKLVILVPFLMILVIPIQIMLLLMYIFIKNKPESETKKGDIIICFLIITFLQIVIQLFYIISYPLIVSSY